MVRDRDRQDVELVEFLVVALRAHEPTVRAEVVAAARARVATDSWPSAFDVAGTVVAEFA
jgi:hypothetical protein